MFRVALHKFGNESYFVLKQSRIHLDDRFAAKSVWRLWRVFRVALHKFGNESYELAAFRKTK